MKPINRRDLIEEQDSAPSQADETPSSSDSDDSDNPIYKQMMTQVQKAVTKKVEQQIVQKTEVNKQKSSSSSLQSSDSDSESDNLQQLKKLPTQTQVQKKDIGDVLKIVDQNERDNREMAAEADLAEAQLLLTRDSRFTQIKHIRMIVAPISQQLNRKLNKKVQNTCIACYDEFILIGDSSGVIRLFDLNSNQELTSPLRDSETGSVAVTTMSLTKDGRYLLSGYKKGVIAVWDMQNFKKIKILTDIHQSEVFQAQIYLRITQDVLHIVSTEEQGNAYRISLDIQGFLGPSHSKYYLTDERHQGMTSIAVQESLVLPSERSNSWIDARTNKTHSVDEFRNFVVVGVEDMILVFSIYPLDGRLTKISRINIKNTLQTSRFDPLHLPYLSWGFGLTPGSNRSRSILAVAWGKVIQLMQVDSEQQYVVRNGYYCSDQIISSCYFMSESILVIVTNEQNIKMLHTFKFSPGDFTALDYYDDPVRQSSAFKQSVEDTQLAQIDGQIQVQNIRFTTLDSLKIKNFSNTVNQQSRQIVFLCSDQIVKARILTWSEYLKKIKKEEEFTWLKVLKTAVAIYAGELKGFADLPDEMEKRQSLLQSQMQTLIKDQLYEVVSKFKVQDYEIPIRISIEFCINIKSIDFLFSKLVFGIFVERQQSELFVSLLEPFILAGNFSKHRIPDFILKQIIEFYEKQGKYKRLDKIISKLDLSKSELKQELLLKCQKYNMTYSVANLALEVDNFGEVLGCKQLLTTMFQMLKLSQESESLQAQKDNLFRQVTKDHVLKLRSNSQKEKHNVEISNCYAGYKLFYMINMFLEGQKFPEGNLSNDQWRCHVQDIAQFLTNELHLQTLLDVDSEMLFFVAEKLLKGKPWQFVYDMLEQTSDSNFLLDLVESKGLLAIQKGSTAVMDNYYKLVLNLLISNSQETSIVAMNQYRIMTQAPIKQINLNYQSVFKALVSHLEPRKANISEIDEIIVKAKKEQPEQYTTDQELIIKSLRAMPLMKMSLRNEDVEILLKLLEQQNQDSLSIQIELYLARQDYNEVFECLIRAKQPQRLFIWLESTLNQLKQEEHAYDALKSRVYYRLHDVAEIELQDDRQQISRNQSIRVSKQTRTNIWDQVEKKMQTHFCQKSNKLMSDWFNEPKQIEQFLLVQLSNKPEVQFHFLNTFVYLNQADLESVINSSVYQPELIQKANLLQSYLIAYIELMCRYAINEVEFWVSQDYFPAEQCLKVCQKHKNEMGEYKCTERLNKFPEAINILLSAINRIDCKRVLDQLDLIQMRARNDWKFGSVFEYVDGLGLFDTLLSKAIAIAQRQKNQDQLWFMILEYLQNFITNASQKVEEVNKKEFKIIMTARQTVPTKIKIDRLKDFVMQRISYILQIEGLDIRLAVIMDKLKLEYQQVQVLFKFKQEIQKEQNNLLARYNSVILQDVFVLFQELKQTAIQGIRVNAKLVRIQEKDNYVLRNISDQLCCVCKQLIVNQVVTERHKPDISMKVFPSCGHACHIDCFNFSRIPKKCPQCCQFAFKDDQETNNDVEIQQETFQKQVESSFAALNQKQQDLNLAAKIAKQNNERRIAKILSDFDSQPNYLCSDDFK